MSGPNDTVWFPNKPEEGEYAGGTATGLVDSSGNQLVDSSGNSLFDDGTTYTSVPQTVWSTNDTA